MEENFTVTTMLLVNHKFIKKLTYWVREPALKCDPFGENKLKRSGRKLALWSFFPAICHQRLKPVPLCVPNCNVSLLSKAR